uniref:Uncharacterized protein n=1 Tax=Oryza sativa subsp. japonica TaxID=39947 RepID=Q8LNN9_ORYSJ|nr:hypothetical protein [Oryza sativa Japonica Group]
MADGLEGWKLPAKGKLQY